MGGNFLQNRIFKKLVAGIIALILDVGIGVEFYEGLQVVLPLELNCDMHGRPSTRVPEIYIEALLDEHLDHLRTAASARAMQQRGPVQISNQSIGPVLQSKHKGHRVTSRG